MICDERETITYKLTFIEMSNYHSSYITDASLKAELNYTYDWCHDTNPSYETFNYTKL